MTAIKICGVTSVADAVLCADAGADALGLNFWPGTERCCSLEVAAEISATVGERVQLVAVFVDAPLHEIQRTLARTGIPWAQLHGDEPPDLVRALLPHAYKALRVGDDHVQDEARRYPGEHLLLDALVRGRMGGTGHTFDWSLAAGIARERLLTLAGGLTSDNVGSAIEQVRPHRVDVASGVEASPRKKSPERVGAFIDAVRSADARGAGPAPGPPPPA
jgi:phosphoribosylanthranilate isomerase